MMPLSNTFTLNLDKVLDDISPSASAKLGAIDKIQPELSGRILKELVSRACQATHVGVIEAARAAIAKLPAKWLQTHLVPTGKETLNFNDEWEFRRWLELLRQAQPSAMAEFIRTGLSSAEFGVREAAEFYAAGRHGSVEGLSDPR